MQTAGATRLYALRHKDKPYHDGWFQSWAEEPSASHPYRYDDGVSIWLASVDLSPDDDFLGQGSPVDVVEVLAQKFVGQGREGDDAEQGANDQ